MVRCILVEFNLAWRYWTSTDAKSEERIMPLYISSARAFFEDLTSRSDPYEYLAELPNPQNSLYPVFEQDWLDFKSYTPDEKHAKRIWSKALSGFANLTDGIIVWGIDARKTPPRDIDAACGLNLVNDPAAFESKLRDWIRDATNPPVMGVDYKKIIGPNGDGFLLCFIPESTHKPHRAEWADRQYYYRASDDFLPADPAMLRLLFYPRYSPSFEIAVEMAYMIERLTHETICKLNVNMYIENSGNESARDVCIGVLCDVSGHSPNVPNPWLHNSNNWKLINVLGSNLVVMSTIPLHPGYTLRFVHSTPWMPPLRNLRPNIAASKLLPQFQDILFHFHVYAHDATHTKYMTSFSQDDFDSANPCRKICVLEE